MKSEKLGIIGGMGPMATSVFIEKIIGFTQADTDQEHIPMVIEICPDIPDRTAFILDSSKPDPIDKMISLGLSLKSAGAVKLAIPCVSSMGFVDILEEKTGLPVFDMTLLVATYLKEKRIKSVGIMATDGTLRAGILQENLRKKDIEVILPDEKYQAYVMSIIYDYIKASKPYPQELFSSVSEHLYEKNAEGIVLGCTELSIPFRHCKEDVQIIDMLDILARECVKDFTS